MLPKHQVDSFSYLPTVTSLGLEFLSVTLLLEEYLSALGASLADTSDESFNAVLLIKLGGLYALIFSSAFYICEVKHGNF